MHEATHHPSIWLQRASAAPGSCVGELYRRPAIQSAGRTCAPRPVGPSPADRLCICKSCSRLLTGHGSKGLGLELEIEPSRPRARAGDFAQGTCRPPRRESLATYPESCTTLCAVFLPGHQHLGCRGIPHVSQVYTGMDLDDSLVNAGHRLGDPLGMTSSVQ